MAFDKGAGFPSCNRELDLIEPNHNDPNGYYAYLDLPPWVGIDEIRRRCRRLMKKHHPDGWKPNREKFEKVEEIYKTLTDPVRKAQYDHTPEDLVWIDQEYIQQVRDKAKTIDEISELLIGNDPQEYYSYFTEGEVDDDTRALAQEWYRVLCPTASELGHRGHLRLHLTGRGTSYTMGEEIYIGNRDPSWTEAVRLLSAPEMSGV